MSYSLGNAGIPQTQVCKKKKLSELSVNTKPLIVEDAAKRKKRRRRRRKRYRHVNNPRQKLMPKMTPTVLNVFTWPTLLDDL